jgi:hypothetical protein
MKINSSETNIVDRIVVNVDILQEYLSRNALLRQLANLPFLLVGRQHRPGVTLSMRLVV